MKDNATEHPPTPGLFKRLIGAWRRMWARVWNRYYERVVPDAIPFQVGIDVIIVENPSFLLMSVFYLVIGLVATLGIIASVLEVDMIVTAGGRLTTENPPLQIQPMDRAILRELKVKAGDTVRKGQVLATFDATFSQADLVSLQGQQQALQVQGQRLEHEIHNTPFEIGANPNVDEQLQWTLLQRRQAEYQSRLKMFDEEMQRIRASLRATEDDRASLATLLKISKEVEGMRDTLQKSGTGSQLHYQDSKANRVRTEQTYQEAGNRLLELQHNLDAKKAERQAFMDQWTRTLMDQLISTRNELAKLNEMLNKAKRLSDMETMTSPVDGMVLEVAKRAEGSVLSPAELLISIVPGDAVLIAEIMLDSGDVGYVRRGDRVVLKINAFPYQRHGILEGELQFVSQESFQSGDARNGAGAFHIGRVKLTKTKLDHLPEGARLLRGMTLAANIKVGSRKLIEYFIYTLTSMADESLKER
ncbi:MAG: HlyD family type I secretion periplasmic adaptor subunit [Magnetococcales bacterium]|nr:HlyD family type I secretion periplasmic adaptor subunit [Magnetococcales bacterium]